MEQKKFSEIINEAKTNRFLKGGRAEKENINSIDDLVKKHKQKDSGKYDEHHFKKQLKDGIKIEMEHTDNAKIAKEIAMDHLTEHPQYYTILKGVGL